MSKKIWIGLCIGIVIVGIILITIFLNKPTNNQVVVGWIGSLSGEYASYGKMVKVGTEIAVDEVNAAGGIDGKKLVVIYEDDQLDPQKGVAAFNKLISVNNVPIVIQAAGSNVMLAEAPIAEQNKVVLISPTCTSPKITNAGDYVFRIAPSDTYQGRVIAEITSKSLKAKKVAVLYINNDYGVGLKDVFIDSFKEMGGQVALSEGFDPETKDFRTLLGKIKEVSPDVVFLSSLYQESALILKQAKEQGISVQFIGGDGCFAPELIARGGNAAEGFLVINMHWDSKSSDPAIQKFVQAVKERIGAEPEVYAALGYDCLKVVADAIKRGGATSDGIKQALYATKSFPGLTGPTIFDGNGDVLKTYDLFVVKNGKFEKR